MQFGHQEPDTLPVIQSFCKREYNVSFPIFDKVSRLGCVPGWACLQAAACREELEAASLQRVWVHWQCLCMGGSTA
jgi:glutathione peroxidase-family protein